MSEMPVCPIRSRPNDTLRCLGDKCAWFDCELEECILHNLKYLRDLKYR